MISRSLAKIFNISLKTGVFPVEWKYARLAPIFKGGLKSETGNYRPISVLSTLARVFERIIYNQLSNYFESNGYLTKCQSGFRKFHSTLTAILKNSNDWLLNMDNGSINGMVLFDLKKAFDTVDHEILLSKLASYGGEHKWFKSYLTSRKHCCILEGERSSMEEVTCGISQGSCLGPLLFLIYINNLPLALANCGTSIFADDSGIMAASKTVNEIQSLLQEDIDFLVVWMNANKLTLNLLKTEFMIIGSKPKLKDIDETISITIIGEEIYRSPYVKSLGFIIDQNLDWQDMSKL